MDRRGFLFRAVGVVTALALPIARVTQNAEAALVRYDQFIYEHLDAAGVSLLRIVRLGGGDALQRIDTGRIVGTITDGYKYVVPR